ncbi:hypothetical protein ACQKWADRAFT_280885 [Trichoderma austrokoningii]
MPSLKPHHHHPHHILFLSLSCLALIPPTHANTEKAIFTGPEPITLSNIPPALAGHNIPTLGPSTRWSIRTNLTRVFPLSRAESEQGYPSWLLLDTLTPGQRYELRVCWSALQPTAFTLDTYTLSTIFSTPSLLQSLAQQQSHDDDEAKEKPPNHPLTAANGSSVLFLRVLAAADYFSHHSSLMTDPPPVLVDLILDPYIYNVLPQSLVPTVGYIVVISIVSWFVARWISTCLVSAANSGDEQAKKRN